MKKTIAVVPQNDAIKLPANAANTKGGKVVVSSLDEFVKKKNPILYEILKNCSILHALCNKQKKYITLFMQCDEDILNERLKKSKSMNKAAIEEAKKECLSEIIYNIPIGHLDDLYKYGKDLPNLLKQKIVIDREKSKGGVLYLTSGAKLESINKLAFAEAGENGGPHICLFKLVGNIGINNEPSAINADKLIQSLDKNAAFGGNKAEEEDSKPARLILLYETEKEFLVYFKNRLFSSIPGYTKNTRIRNPYIETTYSFLNYLIKKDDPAIHSGLLIGMLIPRLTFSIIDFYLVFEPQRTEEQSGKYIVPDYLIEEWYENRGEFDVAPYEVVQEIEKIIEKQSKVNTAAAIYKSPQKVLNEIENIRDDLRLSVDLSLDIKNIYTEVFTTNKIGGIDNIWPAELFEYYSGNPMKKLIEDELVFNCITLFNKLFSQRSEDDFISLFNSITVYIDDLMTEDIAKIFKNMSVLFSKSQEKKRECTSRKLIFLNSSAFLYFCINDGTRAANRNKDTIYVYPTYNDMKEGYEYDQIKNNYDQIKKIGGTIKKNDKGEKVVSLLKMAGVKMSPDLKEKIKEINDD